MQEGDAGFFGNCRQAVVKRIQIPAVPLGKFQLPGQESMHFCHGCDFGAVDGHILHQGSP